MRDESGGAEEMNQVHGSSARPRLLDLYCGAGGCSAGYTAAGFDCTGVDQDPKMLARYPYDTIRADAITVLNTPRFLRRFDLIHASPPCQTYSVTRHTHHRQHPDQLAPTLDLLQRTGIPWIVENVPGAPMTGLVLCGTMFDLTAADHDGTTLTLRRHRLFASNLTLSAPRGCGCRDVHRRRARNLRLMDASDRIGGVYGGGSHDNGIATKVRRGGYTPAKDVWADLMQIRWMTRDQLAQAIPPAYTQWLGLQALDQIGP